MKTNQSEMAAKETDKELIQSVLSRYALTQVSLAEMLCISESSVSRVVHGLITLRPAVRKRLQTMLAEAGKE